MTKKRMIREYKFEQKIRETVIADSEEQALEKLAEWYGDTSDFELVNVTTFEETK